MHSEQMLHTCKGMEAENHLYCIRNDIKRDAFREMVNINHDKINHNYNHTINELCKFSLSFFKTDNYGQNMSIFIMFNNTPDFFLIRPHHIGILSTRSAIT